MQLSAIPETPGLTQPMQPADQFDYEEEEVPAKAKAKAKPAARQRTEAAPKKPANGTKARKRPAARDNDTDDDEDIIVDIEDDEEATPKKKKRKPATDTGGGSLLSPEMQAFLGVQRMNRFKVRHVGPICNSVAFLAKAWLRGITSRAPICSAQDLIAPLQQQPSCCCDAL